jgi:hypothetical protein
MHEPTDAKKQDRRTSDIALWVKIERVVIIVTMLACTMATIEMISRFF